MLKLPRAEFEAFVAGKKVGGRAYEQHLFNRLSRRCLKSYQNQLKEWFADDDAVRLYGSDGLEWWLRVHLIVDHVSAMTDDFCCFLNIRCLRVSGLTIKRGDDDEIYHESNYISFNKMKNSECHVDGQVV